MKARPPTDSRDAHTRASRATRGPFSRPLNVHDVKDSKFAITIEAKPEELAVIAEAVGLPSVQRLKVRYRIVEHAGGRYDLSGDLDANITQVCVVTLESFASDVTNEIDLTFAQPIHVPEMSRHKDKTAARGRDKPMDLAPMPVPGNDDQEDPADPIVDDTIDLGAVALEFLTLACDLYPRKPGIAFSDVIVGDVDDREPSAFAALERLKDRS